jgi:threonyl-tRNA synthetase
MDEAGFRADADDRDETLGKRIRDAELQKIPYVVVWGDRETREAMAVRKRGGEGVSTMSLDELLDAVVQDDPLRVRSESLYGARTDG